jgi:hypothetical protein
MCGRKNGIRLLNSLNNEAAPAWEQLYSFGAVFLALINLSIDTTTLDFVTLRRIFKIQAWHHCGALKMLKFTQ